MIDDFNVGKFAGILPHATAHMRGAQVLLTQVPDEDKRE
jgi:hypothetical protein